MATFYSDGPEDFYDEYDYYEDFDEEDELDDLIEDTREFD